MSEKELEGLDFASLPLSRFPGADGTGGVGDVDDLLADLDLRPELKFDAVRAVLRLLVTDRLLQGQPFTRQEAKFLATMLYNLAATPKALRELGIKQTKQRPTRDYQIAADYLWLRECGVRSQDATLLLIRKWSESESNIKRLIHGHRRQRALEILPVVRGWAVNKPLVFDGYRIVARDTWRTFALREADGSINADAQAAAVEIEQLTARIMSAGER